MSRAVILSALVALSLACGSSQPKVEQTVPMKLLDSVPPAEREPVAAAFVEVWTAEREVDRWQHVREVTRHEIDYARAEKSQAEAERKMARFELKRGKAAYQRALIKQASQAMDSGRSRIRALSKKIKYLKAKLQHAERELEAARAREVAAEAAFEQEKAKVVKKRGLASKGFKHDTVAAQAQRAKSHYQGKRKAANQARGKAEKRRKAWRSAKK